MLCYVMLCYVMLCYVMLCYVMLCYVMLCYVMLCHSSLVVLESLIKPAKYCFINNSRTAWPTEMLMQLLSLSHNLLQDAYHFSISDDNN